MTELVANNKHLQTMTTAEKIDTTGNPFVDTGLAVIAAISNLDDVSALTLSDVVKVFGDGSELTNWNSRLKSFTQVFGTNDPLYQSSYGYSSMNGPSEFNKAVYRSTLRNFLHNISSRDVGRMPAIEVCQSCGRQTSFSFSRRMCKRNS